MRVLIIALAISVLGTGAALACEGMKTYPRAQQVENMTTAPDNQRAARAADEAATTGAKEIAGDLEKMRQSIKQVKQIEGSATR